MDAENKGATLEPNGQGRESALLAVVELIRKESGHGRFVLAKEALSEIRRRGLLDQEKEEGPDVESDTLLQEALERTEDLRQAIGKDGASRYYSSKAMTDAYAGILILKEEDPLHMMAEIVRENSALYPRPIRLDAFTASPFDLTREEVLVCLQRMAGQEEYRDIATTQTSIGTDFLYSTRHLEPDYAAMLAEWYDVGQSKNP
jgi:hypothetical protein